MNVDPELASTFDDVTAGKAGEKAEDRGVNAVVIEREGDVQPLAVGSVHGIARTRDRIGLQAIAGDVVVDGRIGGESVDQGIPFLEAAVNHRKVAVK